MRLALTTFRSLALGRSATKVTSGHPSHSLSTDGPGRHVGSVPFRYPYSGHGALVTVSNLGSLGLSLVRVGACVGRPPRAPELSHVLAGLGGPFAPSSVLLSVRPHSVLFCPFFSTSASSMIALDSVQGRVVTVGLIDDSRSHCSILSVRFQ